MKDNEKNPFYDNHIFKSEDLERAKIKWQDRLWLWIYPTFVQVSEGYAFQYKIVNGCYYVMKFEKINYPKK